MKIKDIWNVFLEPEESPTCNAIVILGLVELFFVLIPFAIFTPYKFIYSATHNNINFDEVIINLPYILDYSLKALSLFRKIVLTLCYLAFVLVFIADITYHIEKPVNFTKNSKIYRKLWDLGTISFIICRLLDTCLYFC